MTVIAVGIIVGWIAFAAGAITAIVWMNQQDNG